MIFHLCLQDFLIQFISVPDEINQTFVVDAGNKNTAGSNNLLRGTLKSLSMQNCIRRCAHKIYISTFNVFWKFLVDGLLCLWCRNSYPTWFWAESTVNNCGNCVTVGGPWSHWSVNEASTRDYCRNKATAINPVRRGVRDTIPW